MFQKLKWHFFIPILCSGTFLEADDCLWENNDCQEEICCPQEDCSFFTGLSFEGSYIYWRPWQEAPEFIGVGDIYPGNIIVPKFEWQSGYKVAAGLEFCNLWKIKGEYTHFRSHYRIIVDEPSFPNYIPQFSAFGSQLLPELSLSVGDANTTLVTRKLKLDYNVFDCYLMREICISECVNLYLYFGGRGVWYKEKLKEFSSGTLDVTSGAFGSGVLEITSGDFTLNLQDSNKISAGGPRFGAIGEMFFYKGFFIEAEVSSSVVFGQYKNRYSHVPNVSSFPEEIGGYAEIFEEYYLTKGRENFFDFNFNFEAFIAIGWEYIFCNDSKLKVLAGYEAVFWPQLVQFRLDLSNKAEQISLTQFGGTNGVEHHFAGISNNHIRANSIGLHGLRVTASCTF